jgi:hypothetical protein
MSAFDASQYPDACPHEPIYGVGPGVYFAPGSIRMAPLMRLSRNMVVVRNGGELTLVNPIRLSPEGEADLENLGTVRHVMRLGIFHGVDDAYTVARVGAEFWCQDGSDHYANPKPDHGLTEGGPLPIPDAELFAFRETTKPECALLIGRGKGLLITCDGVQHYGDYSRQSPVAKMLMPLIGFPKSVVLGPFWLKNLTKNGGSVRPDFDRLLELDFDTLISAHGTPLMTGAHDAVTAAVDRAFGS